MSKITKIEEQKKKKNRVNLYIDGEFASGLYKETLIKYHLYVGKELSHSELISIQSNENLVEAKERARNYLSYRHRSKKEVNDYLIGKGFNKEVIEKVKNDFENVGLLNDCLFAERWVKDRNARNPKGHFALRMELKEKGISDVDIEKTLKFVDERENACKAALKAIKKYSNKKDSKKKILTYLQRRGFPLYLSREAMEENE